MNFPTPDGILAGHNGPRTSWAVGAFTGYKLYKQGTHSNLRVLDLALGWRMWTAVLMWWVGAWAIATTYTIGVSLSNGSALALVVLIPFSLLNAVVIYFAMGVVFVRLCVQSQFNIRGPFKPAWRQALRVPNVAPIWMYLAPFLPLMVSLDLLGIAGVL